MRYGMGIRYKWSVVRLENKFRVKGFEGLGFTESEL